jgi:hypothetical protein
VEIARTRTVRAPFAIFMNWPYILFKVETEGGLLVFNMSPPRFENRGVGLGNLDAENRNWKILA